MGLTHIRTPKNFVLEERLERYAAAIEQRPTHLAGRWAEAAWPLGVAPGRFTRVHLDLGCGKGTYIARAATEHPDTLFIGMDIEPICIAYAAQRIVEEAIPNALVIPRGADALTQLFAPGELDAITLNFPTPHPRSHDAHRRLTNVDRLNGFRVLLVPGGTVTLRTDSQPLRDFSHGQFTAAGYRILWSSDDVRTEHPEHPITEYEQRLIDQGARVWGLCATPGPAPTQEALAQGRTQEQSLMRYLPEDLESLDYVPLGMEAAVTNLINRRRRARERDEQRS